MTTRRGAMRRRRVLFRAACLGLVLGAGAVAAELGYSAWRWAFRAPRHTYWIFEESRETYAIDLDLGYRVKKSARVARITEGAVDYVGEVYGNNESFPDRDDFGPRTPGVPRLGILGDSFTAGFMVGTNWPDRVEEAARAEGAPIEALNMATDGGGLANWHAIATRHLPRAGYELDGLVLAVWPGDLHRRLIYMDHSQGGRARLAFAPSWDPASRPTTTEAVGTLLTERDGWIVSGEEFSQALRGEVCPRAFEFKMLGALGRALRRPEAPTEQEAQARERVIEELRRAAGLPMLVIRVPTSSGLCDPALWAREQDTVKAFADSIGADYLDGTDPFRGMTPERVASEWVPNGDAHWNQRGSDRFAAWALPRLREWIGARAVAGR
jgi:hypothetical protein